MNGYLLDTNCISELVRTRPEPRVINWVEAADQSVLHLSVLTLGEIRKGIAGLPQSKRRTALESWLSVELVARFAGRILAIDGAVADRWGGIAAAARKTGKGMSVIDGLLAATAIQHDLTIVSRNEEDFVGVDVTILNPWKM